MTMTRVKPEMYAALRHDTFLTLTEYARQLHAIIITDYHPKWPGAMNNSKERKRLLQNMIDNQMQDEARKALRRLAEDQVEEIVQAYTHLPRDDQELAQLLDNLNIQGAKRGEIIRRVTGGKGLSQSQPSPTATATP